jgi:VanZ family protein
LLKWSSRAALVLFWPALAYIVWGELTPSPPAWTSLFWDKALHFTAYFGLAAMTTMILGPQRRTLWALLGLAVLGGLLEILQGYTGRDPDIYDALANICGIATGASAALLLTMLLRNRTLVGAPAAE